MPLNITPAQGNPTPWAVNSLLSDNASIITWVGCDGSRWPLSGGLAPIPGAQEGASLVDIKGLMAPFKHLDKQGARQDGADWVDAVYEVGEIDMTISLSGNTPAGYRRVQRGWMNSWDARRTGRLCWFTTELGEWWIPLRLHKEPTDTIRQAPAMMTRQQFMWTGRADYPLWASFDSTSQQTASTATTLVDPAGQNHNGWLPLWNRGDQDGWPRYLVQGPGTFTIGNNGDIGAVIFGPLTAGQSALITTLPRKRSIIEMTTQANLYPLLTGRFSASVPAGKAIQVPVSVTGATPGLTSIVGSLTPYRKWPE